MGFYDFVESAKRMKWEAAMYRQELAHRLGAIGISYEDFCKGLSELPIASDQYLSRLPRTSERYLQGLEVEHQRKVESQPLVTAEELRAMLKPTS